MSLVDGPLNIYVLDCGLLTNVRTESAVSTCRSHPMRDGVEDEDRDGREADDRIMPSSFLVLSLSLSQALLQDSKAQLGELRFLYLLQLQLSACRLTGDATKQGMVFTQLSRPAFHLGHRRFFIQLPPSRRFWIPRNSRILGRVSLGLL